MALSNRFGVARVTTDISSSVGTSGARWLANEETVEIQSLRRLLDGMKDLCGGNFRRRVMATGGGLSAELATAFNELAERNQRLVGEMDRVRTAVGKDGQLGERVELTGDGDGWSMAGSAMNGVIEDLLRPTTELSRVLEAVAEGDLSRRMPGPPSGSQPHGEFGGLSTTVNSLLDRLSVFADEVTRVAREVGTEGQLGGQAEVPGVAGTWRDLTDSVNSMAGNLTEQVRDISRMATAVARGDLTQKIDVEVSGEILELKNTLNTMVDQLSAFADEVTRVAREVGTEGQLGGQAQVPGVAGTWRDLTDSVNSMAGNLTNQVRSIAGMATAVARGDLTQKITVDARGEILELKTTLNTMVDQLSAFADEVTQLAREVGTDGRLGGQARIRGIGGTWKDLTVNVNEMAANLTSQVRNIATVATAVAGGDLSKKITVEAKGEVAALAETINTMVDTLRAFADEVTRVAREVGTEGILGGQAQVRDVAGTWKDLTDNVNSMAGNLTSQVRNIALVTSAIARGDLTKKIDVDARGEILELKTTLNTTVDQLSAFASEVTRVAREVGTEGKLGGQAEVEGVSGTWQRLTDSVNRLAGNLTEQVRAIAGVATAVTAGDLTQQITVDASGEILELKNNINQMIANLEETTTSNLEQDWLKTNLARISALMQGHRDLSAVASLLLSELVPLVSAQQGAFFLAQTDADGESVLERIASYGCRPPANMPARFRGCESLVGQAAADLRTIIVTDAPPSYASISFGLGDSAPANVVVLPVLFEGAALGVLELATVNEFSSVHLDLLEQLKRNIGVNLNTILANARTEALLAESQRLTQELRAQQDELQRSNTELEEKATLLASQNRDIEIKNTEIEQARLELEERAQQLSTASKYKSEFMANMSHELRTPLNSALILTKLLADNPEGHLSPKEVEFAQIIYSAGSDLLGLINDILDLAKVEAGRIELQPTPVSVKELVRYVETLCGPLVAEKGLEFSVQVAPDVPPSLNIASDRLRQILRNLLSNAVKFTHEGSVHMGIRLADPVELASDSPLRNADGLIAFDVCDTGIGIATDKLPVIFEAFQQADGTINRHYGGTGLGLTISRELTRLLGGELHVSSEPGVGSTLTLYVPPHRHPETVSEPGGAELAPALVDGAPTVSADDTAVDGPDPVKATDRQSRFNGEKVLIIDDDPRTVFALSTLLQQHGLCVRQAEDGATGIEVLHRDKDIVLVLLDIMLPGLDGYATAAEIRKEPEYADLPIIAVTAKAMKGDREKSLNASFTDYVTKPVDTEHLLRRIAVNLRTPSMRQ